MIISEEKNFHLKSDLILHYNKKTTKLTTDYIIKISSLLSYFLVKMRKISYFMCHTKFLPLINDT
jgi:hypothetical protein